MIWLRINDNILKFAVQDFVPTKILRLILRAHLLHTSNHVLSSIWIGRGTITAAPHFWHSAIESPYGIT